MADHFIKICGIQTAEEAALAVAAGANAIGCLVGLTHLAEDKVDVPRARKIFASVQDKLRTVLVTHTTAAARIVEMARSTNATAVQLHGECTVKTAAKVREGLPDAFLIKAVHVTGLGAIEESKRWEGVPIDAMLLDSRTADRLGGTGKTHDWSISARIVAESRFPIILAGGLGAHNVGEAIRAVRPMGVDVNSGVELPGGQKSPDKVRGFVDGATAAFAENDRPST